MNLETYVKFIKKWEGGLSGDPSDSCSAMYCPVTKRRKEIPHEHGDMLLVVGRSIRTRQQRPFLKHE